MLLLASCAVMKTAFACAAMAINIFLLCNSLLPLTTWQDLPSASWLLSRARCPFCPAALPQGITRWVLAKGEQHYKDQRKKLKKKVFRKQIFAAHGKQATERPDIFVDYMTSGKRTGLKLERKFPDPHVGGHQLALVKPD